MFTVHKNLAHQKSILGMFLMTWYPVCCLRPAIVSESLFLSVQSSALTLCLLWAVLTLCGVTGIQADQFWGNMPTRELGSREVVLAKFALGHKSYAGFPKLLWQLGTVGWGGWRCKAGFSTQ